MADLIDRQAAIETAVSYIEEWNGAQSKFHRNRITERFLNLPSAQSERWTGEWITKSTNGEMFDSCSVCGYVEWDVPRNYCPNCGARMKGEADG